MKWFWTQRCCQEGAACIQAEEYDAQHRECLEARWGRENKVGGGVSVSTLRNIIQQVKGIRVVTHKKKLAFYTV